MIVAPGFIDMHVHLREPGQENSKTIETGTRSAARGGFTAVCCMPNTKPVNDNASVTRFIMDRAKAAASVRVWPIGAASVGSKGEAIAEIAAMRAAGIVAVSDDGKADRDRKAGAAGDGLLQVAGYSGDRALRRCFARAGAVMREGVTSTRLGLARHAGGGGIGVRRARRAARRTDGRAIAHRASFGEGLARSGALCEVAQACRVTCEVTPHHFTLIDEDVQYDSRFKMNPPLAAREDREALLAGLADGNGRCIATDHAPHEPALKDVEFDSAPFGILGFETAICACRSSSLFTAGRISLMRMVELFTTGPARVLGMERTLAAGQPADVTIFSTDRAVDLSM